MPRLTGPVEKGGNDLSIVYGSGGGGGKGGKGGGEAPNTLRSRATISTLYGLSEGEIDDLTAQELKQRILFDKVPLADADGRDNFEGVRFAFSTGTQDQSFLKGFGDSVEAEYPVNESVKRDVGPVRRYLDNRNFDYIRIRLQWPGLLESRRNKLVGSRVEFTITIQDSSGAYLTRDEAGTPGAARFVIEGKTQNYERVYLFELNNLGPWQVTIERLTEDSETSTVRNDMVWASFTGIIADRYRYPNLSLLGIELDSEEFDGVPEQRITPRGIKWKYPSTYNPKTRTYTGFFDGTLSEYGYTNNPAWVLYGLLTNSRFGTGGSTPEEIIDVYTLYQIAQYCDALVSDGKGGREPRFVCNAYIQQAEDAPRVIDQIVTLFRGILYYSGGQILFRQDKPYTLPRRLFTEANVVEDLSNNRPGFIYEGSSARSRHTAVLVKFYDQDNFYAEDYEYVEDEAAIARYGYNPLEITAFGTTSRGQAHRAGLYALLTEQNEKEIVRFSIGSEGYLCQPTEIIQVADPHRLGASQGGRIQAATVNSITLDRQANLLPNRIYSLSVLQSEIVTTVNLSQSQTPPYLVSGAGFDENLIGAVLGSAKIAIVHSSTLVQLDSAPGLGNGVNTEVTFYPPNVAQVKVVTNSMGVHQTLNLISSLPSAPPIHSTWILSDDIQPIDEYRVLQVIPRYDQDLISEWEIVALAYDESKFAAIDAYERGADFAIRRSHRNYPPRNVESKYEPRKGLLSISWEPPVKTRVDASILLGTPSNLITGNSLVAGYRPQYREVNGNWVTLSLTADTRIEAALPAEEYEVRVQAIDARGNILSVSAIARNANYDSDFSFPYGPGLIVHGII